MKKYAVRVTKPIFYTVVVEVEAEDPTGAARSALALVSDDCNTIAWKEKDADYQPHPERVLPTDEAEEGETLEEFVGESETEYLLLAADVSSGEGITVLQPWMREQSALMLADLTGDWVDQLDEIKEWNTEEWHRQLEWYVPPPAGTPSH